MSYIPDPKNHEGLTKSDQSQFIILCEGPLEVDSLINDLTK